MLEKVLPAVVSVRVEGTAAQGQKVPEEFKKFFGDELPDQPAQPFEGLGSGVIIDAAKGYVLTNNHVINQAQKSASSLTMVVSSTLSLSAATTRAISLCCKFNTPAT